MAHLWPVSCLCVQQDFSALLGCHGHSSPSLCEHLVVAESSAEELCPSILGCLSPGKASLMAEDVCPSVLGCLSLSLSKTSSMAKEVCPSILGCLSLSLSASLFNVRKLDPSVLGCLSLCLPILPCPVSPLPLSNNNSQSFKFFFDCWKNLFLQHIVEFFCQHITNYTHNFLNWVFTIGNMVVYYQLFPYFLVQTNWSKPYNFKINQYKNDQKEMPTLDEPMIPELLIGGGRPYIFSSKVISHHI